MKEFDNKIARLRALLAAHQLDALVLRRVSSFSWATCGASSSVNTASSFGEASLWVTRDRLYLLTNNIEAPRLEQEEGLASQGWEFRVGPWHEQSARVREVAGNRLGADDAWDDAKNLSGEIARLRANLTPDEGDRMREVSRLSAEALGQAIHAIRPGQTEFEIAGLLAEASLRQGVTPTVLLVAADERVASFRHPLPTARALDKYAMLVLCGRRRGLVCSLTRLVHFGRLPDDLRRRVEATAVVDAAFIQATRPGRRLAEVFAAGVAAYAAAGYPDEWRRHHQGGPAGYEPREYLGTPDAQDVVSVGQAYAWNPSITGVKSEDTILVTEAGYEVLTAMPGWPTLDASASGATLARPAILEVL